MMVAILASRLLGLIRDMLIASQFGLTGLVSAYTVSFNLPDLLYFFLSSGALSGAFIPVFTERYQTDRKREAWEIFSIIACFMGLVLMTVIVISEVFTEPLVRYLAAPGYADPKYQELFRLIVHLTRIILPCQLFFFLGGLMMGTLESRQDFRARAAGPVIYNLGIIFGVVILSRWFSIAGLAWGAMIGAFAGNVGYTFYCLKKSGFEFYPSLNLRHPGVKKVGMLALPVILGLSLPQIDVIINRWFATYVSDIAPAALNYANRLMQVPLGVFAQAAGTAILPTLSAYAARNAIDDLRNSVSFGLRAILAINIPASVFMVVMADPIVRTVYMSGEFSPSKVPATSIALICYSVGIFAWAGQAIVARGFFAMQDTITPVVLGTVATIIFIPLNFILARVMGHGGLALATSIAATIHLLALTVFLRRRLQGLEGGKLLSSTAKILIATAVMGALCIGVRVGMSRTLGTWQLQEGDVRDPTELALQLGWDRTPLTHYLDSQMSKETKAKRASAFRAAYQSYRIEAEVEDFLQTIVWSRDFYDDERFEDVSISGRTQDLVHQRPTRGSSLWRMNRGLLEAAYPQAFVRIADVSSVAKWLEPADRDHRGSGGDRWLIQEGDIVDLESLAHELVNKENPVSVYLLSEMPHGLRTGLRSYVADADAARGLDTSLMHDLNRVIRTSRLYSPERFGQPTETGTTPGDVRLSEELLVRARVTRGGQALPEINRRLLEEAFPDQIAKRPIDRVEGRMGSLITVLVAMALSTVVYLPLLKLTRVEEVDAIWGGLRRKLSRRQPMPPDTIDQPETRPADES